MSDNSRSPICLLACTPARPLAERVARHLLHPLAAGDDTWFACGEGKYSVGENVRGCDVYLFQQPVVPGSRRSIYDRFVMLLHAIDAARCADADRVTAVVPYLPGGRQDKRKGKVREGVSTGLFARMLTDAGADMVITVEPHNEAMIGCFAPRKVVFESVGVTQSFSRYLQSQGLVCDTIASTDVGGLERARHYAETLGRPLAALSKQRDYSQPSTVAQTTVIGDVKGRSVLVVDDIIDTAGSVCSAVRTLWDEGATDIVVAGVHVLLSEPGPERLAALHAEAQQRGVSLAVVGTSSVEHPELPEWYRSWSLEPLLAQIIRNVNTRGSVRALEGP
jgi:ribose-phosphate pyrophosphokinase